MDEQTFKKLLDDSLEPVKEDIKVLKEGVNTLKGSVLNIEKTMTSYADSYKINKMNIERVDTRLSGVEENLGI